MDRTCDPCRVNPGVTYFHSIPELPDTPSELQINFKNQSLGNSSTKNWDGAIPVDPAILAIFPDFTVAKLSQLFPDLPKEFCLGATPKESTIQKLNLPVMRQVLSMCGRKSLN